MTTSPHSGGPLVVLEDVHLTLGSAAGPVNILRGISLAIGAGETVSIIGPSGSGKSTLMMVIGGLERPSTGQVRVDGHDLGVLGEDELARFRRGQIGIVFQSFHLIPTMTALENVAIPLELDGRRDAFDVAEAGLAAVGLGRHETGTYRRFRQQLGRTILLGLELLVVGDIVRTVATQPSLTSVAVLAIIVLIRTFLSFSLEVELTGRWPWQSVGGLPPPE